MPSSFLNQLVSARVLRIATWLWIIAVIAGSLLPGPIKYFFGTTTVHRLNSRMEVADFGHRLWHVAVFGFTALLLLIQSWNSRQYALSTVAPIGLGLSLELAQFVIFGGVFEWWDVRDDSIGVFAALGFFAVLSNRFYSLGKH
jgi:hypothetical protein